MDTMNLLANLTMAVLSEETGINAQVLKNDFKKYNKAIDDLIALGYDEDTAIKEVTKNWKFSGIL